MLVNQQTHLGRSYVMCVMVWVGWNAGLDHSSTPCGVGGNAWEICFSSLIVNCHSSCWTQTKQMSEHPESSMTMLRSCSACDLHDRWEGA